MAFEDLDVWKKSSRLSANIYKEFNGFKDYGFRDQITRAGLSIPCNIAEGIERPQELELVKKLGIPFGQGYFWGNPGEAQN